MSDRPGLRLNDLARMGLIATSLVASLSLGSGSLVAFAQDASPEASPSAECVPAGEISTEMATPAASPAADAEAPTGLPAPEDISAKAEAFIANIIACTAADDQEALATLVTVNLVQSVGGYMSVQDALTDGFFTELPFRDLKVLGVTQYDDGTISVDVQYQQTEYQMAAEEWFLAATAAESALQLNAIKGIAAEVDGSVTAVGVNLLENEDGTYAISPNAPSATATDVLILQAVSPDTNVEPHELVVVQLPEGADPMGLLDGSIPDEDITFIGVVAPVNPGENIDLTLINLPPGMYTLLCFFPSASDGAPHIAHGMVAPFEVTAPAE